MDSVKLFMLLLGCKPKGRHTEQHDIFFGIGNNLKDLVPSITCFWPEPPKIHIDAWREVTHVGQYDIQILQKQEAKDKTPEKLFFLNLGGYKANEFDEFHYKMLVVCNSLDEAKKQAYQTAFFKHTAIPESPTTKHAIAHIDDKYGVDVDDAYLVEDILPDAFKDKYVIKLSLSEKGREDDYNLGYLKLIDL